MAKRNLLGNCVLRRDSREMLWLMNHQEGGWRSTMLPVESVEWFLATYNARLGEWAKDECSEYCPVTTLSREEMETLHDGEEPTPETFHFDDIGPRGVNPIGDRELEAFRALMEAHPGPTFLDDGLTQGGLRELLKEQHDFGPRGPMLVGEEYSPPIARMRDFGVGVEILNFGSRQAKGMQEFLTANPGVILRPGPACYQLAKYPDGHTAFVDEEGNVVNLKTNLTEEMSAFSIVVEGGAAPRGIDDLRDDLNFAQKASLTAEQSEALKEQLVPVFVNGEVVRQDTFAEIRSRVLAQTDGYKLDHAKSASFDEAMEKIHRGEKP
jgi:hypothetical protein